MASGNATNPARSSTTTPFRHYKVISAQLASLPVEIVHKILSDLQVSKVLALISICPNAYLDECVSSHLDLRKLLLASELPEIKHLTMLYLRTSEHQAPHRRTIGIPLLEHDAQVVLRQNKNIDSRWIRAAIIEAIVDKLSIFAEALPVFQEYHYEHNTGFVIPPLRAWGSVPVSADLEYIVLGLTSAADGLKRQQSKQLYRLAALVRDHHHMLKSVHDPSQESRTESHRLHLMGLYKQFARTILNRWRKPSRRLFSGRFFPLVPYDRYLLLFHKTLKRWPQSEHQYPAQLQLVLDGMEYVYPRNDSELRASDPPIEGPTYRYKRMSIDGRSGRITDVPRYTTRHDALTQPLDLYRPWPEAEFEWLEAFISMCGYMSRMQEKWYRAPNNSETVGDFWKKHIRELE